jgi:hypothetical protein
LAVRLEAGDGLDVIAAAIALGLLVGAVIGIAG